MFLNLPEVLGGALSCRVLHVSPASSSRGIGLDTKLAMMMTTTVTQNRMIPENNKSQHVNNIREKNTVLFSKKEALEKIHNSDNHYHNDHHNDHHHDHHQ